MRALLLVALVFASHPAGGAMNYLRPYLAMALVGGTLFQAPDRDAAWVRALGYVAAVSYALYVLHPLLAHSWLGDGDKIVKYLKRPLLFAALFALAHLSTFHFEKRWIEAGRQWVRRRKTRSLHADQPQVASAD